MGADVQRTPASEPRSRGPVDPPDPSRWSAEEWASLIDSHGTVMLVIDPTDGRIVHANRAAEGLYGWSRAELCQRTIDEINTLSAEEVAAEMEAARRAERAYFRFRHRLASGEVRDVEVHSGPVPIGDRELLFSVIIDGAERQEAMAALRASDELAHNIIRSAPIGIAVADLDGQLVEANQAMTTISGYSHDELIGSNIRRLTHPDDLALTDDYLAQVRDGVTETFFGEKRYVRPDGSEAIVEVYTSLLHDTAGAPQRYLGIVRDRTETRRLAEQAQSDREDAERLQRLDRAKNAFLSAVSHELRTPLTVIIGMSETLKTHRPDLEESLVARLEASVLEQSTRLSRLVDDLLQVDRLSRGALVSERSWFDIVELVRRVAAASPLSDRLDLRLPTSHRVHADPVQVEQTLTNLVSNAAKYAPDGPVHVVVDALGADGFRLEVRDHGPGIPSQHRAQVFEPFWRIDDDHPQPGTGIGLALVAEFASLHGGRAWVGSPSDGGAQLVVELPGAVD